MPALIIALLQAVPEILAIWPSIEAVIGGTASAADVAALETATATLNAQAAAAETAAGATVAGA